MSPKSRVHKKAVLKGEKKVQAIENNFKLIRDNFT
jgi:hypothetical protein